MNEVFDELPVSHPGKKLLLCKKLLYPVPKKIIP